MWIFSNDAFLSIVAHKTEPGRFCVRARFKGDLEKVFNNKEVQIIETPEADYRFRTEIDQPMLLDLVCEEALRVDYDNFKSSVREDWRHDVYLDVWSRLWREQEKRTPRAKKKKRKT